MKKFEGILFCTDLDGTLFADDKSLSKENANAIEYFKSEGGLFTFITGRVPLTSFDICEKVKPNAPFGCVNGGGIYDYAEKRFIWSENLPHSSLDLVRHIERTLPDLGIIIYTENEAYFYNDNFQTQETRRFTGLPYVTCPLEDFSAPILKSVFAHHEDEHIVRVGEELLSHPRAGEFDFIRSEKRLFEMLPKGVSKGTVIGKLADLLGIKIDRTVAAGDYNNDITMLSAVHHSFAVANAVPEVNAVSRYHLPVTNNESAIAYIIDGIDTGKYKI